MKTIIVSLLFPITAFSLTSPFSSTVDGLDIPNSHELSEFIVRGQAPRSPDKYDDYDQLVNMGVEKILIFKKQARKEVYKELGLLEDYGYQVEKQGRGRQGDVKWIDFDWRNYPSFTHACKQLMQGMYFIRRAVRQQQRVFFHCTVGEDRTGALAGLYRMKYHNWDLEEAFHQEMCENGYAAGNPFKPDSSRAPVVRSIRRDLTPVFVKMAYLIENRGRMSLRHCETDPSDFEDYRQEYASLEQDLRCETSSRAPSRRGTGH